MRVREEKRRNRKSEKGREGQGCAGRDKPESASPSPKNLQVCREVYVSVGCKGKKCVKE